MIRYALYYAPRADDALATEASQWLGYSPDSGRPRPHPRLSILPPERLAEITAEPRLYGFHGTLKAPIALVDGVSERDFIDAVGRVAIGLRAFSTPALKLAALGDFLSLVPSDRCDPLQDLADRCVIEFDEFRRPADENELARRREAGLTPRQDQLLLRWGYPYVLEEWRFHLTLTGRIADPAERDAVKAVLAQRFRAFIDRPLQVRDLCVFRQPGPGRPFTVLARFQLGGGRVVPVQSVAVWRAS